MQFVLTLELVADFTHTFERVRAHQKDVLVLYRTRWSLGVAQMYDAYEALEKEVGTKRLRVGSVLCDENPEICAAHGAAYFPELRLFAGNKTAKYEGSFELGDMAAWVRQHVK